MRVTVHIRMVKHTARSSLIEAVIFKTKQDIIFLSVDFTFKVLYFFTIFRKSSQSLSLTVYSPLYTRSAKLS